MKKSSTRNTDGSSRWYRGKHIITLTAILACSFLPLASSSIISSSTLTADVAGSTEFFLYKGQDTPVPRSVEHMVVDSSVTYIEDETFRGLENLKTVKLPDSLVYLGNHAFNGCTNLASINLPDSLKFIGNHAFYKCTSLVSIKLPASLKSIEDHAFYKCKGLASIELPDSIRYIGNGAFWECTNLASIKLSESLKHIGDGAFQRCDRLKSVKFPASLKSIGNKAFMEADHLESIEVPPDSSLKSIGADAFNSCRCLVSSIKFPDSLESIGERAFSTCSSPGCSLIIKKSKSFESSDKSIFNLNLVDPRCWSLKSIILPKSLESVEKLGWCTSLASIELPDSLKCDGSSTGCSSQNTIIDLFPVLVLVVAAGVLFQMRRHREACGRKHITEQVIDDLVQQSHHQEIKII